LNYIYAFTVFTAAIRKNTIRRVYEALSKQSFKNFEWLIVDDGSTDDLEGEVKKFIAAGNIPIVYIKKENGGKHTAYNRGLREARGELFLPLDDDDSCVENALEIFYSEWQKIKHDPEFIGICCDCVDQNGTLVGSSGVQPFIDGTESDLRTKHSIRGEKWGFGRTEIAKQYLFPEPKNVKFIMEAIVHERYAHNYKLRYINRPLRIYYVPDLTEKGDNLSYLTVRTAIGMAFSYLYALNNGIRLRSTTRKSLVIFDNIKFCINCWRFNLFAGTGFKGLMSKIKGWDCKLAMTVCYPFGWIFFRKTVAAYPSVYAQLKDEESYISSLSETV